MEIFTKPNDEFKTSSSMESLVSADNFLKSQTTSVPIFDLSQSLDNIILESTTVEEKEILNDNIIIELDSLLDNQDNSQKENISHFNQNNTREDFSVDLDDKKNYEFSTTTNDQMQLQDEISSQNIIQQPITSGYINSEYNLNTEPPIFVSTNNGSQLEKYVLPIPSVKLTSVGHIKREDFSKNNLVSFNEIKGTGILETESSANLVKFFTDPTNFGTDDNGRKFFDTFTSQDSPQKIELPFEDQIITSQSMLEQNFEPLDIPVKETIHDFKSSEESIYEAWIPSDLTRQILYQALSTNIPQTQPISNLALPGIIIEELLGDPIYDLIKQHLGEQEARSRLILTADSVPQDIIGLQQLIKADCLRAAVDLTSRLLDQVGQGIGKVNQLSAHSPYSLQLWFCRFSLLSRLQLFAAAEYEWEAFKNLDTPDLYYEYYQELFPKRRGSMVAFKMRVLHAEFPHYVGKHQESVDRLCYMYAIIQQIIKNLDNGLAEDGSAIEILPQIIEASKALWLQREIIVLHSLANCYLSMKDYLASMDIYNILLKKCPQKNEYLYSTMARISLQVGDIVYATKYYKLSIDFSTNKSTDSITQIIHRGLLEMGNGNFENAYTIFKEAVEKDPKNLMAVNNKAVCALYIGRLKEALQLYESLITIDPSKYLLESIVLNLCTLYELEASKTNLKKLNLLRLIGQYKGTGFNVACLKMT